MWRWLLSPLALLLGGILRVRHWAYDHGLFKSYEADVPTLCIGNLTVGGTGKSPLVADLMERLGTPSGAVVLSRGYGRTTRGFRVVRPSSLAHEVGDEPLQLKRRTLGARVAVCEDRVEGCRRIVKEFRDCPCIVLDDAFQHRRLQASYNILLSRFDRPYSRDWLLPVGLLRDVKSAARRAHAIALTNIPAEVTEAEARALAETLRTNPRQRLLFSSIAYDVPRRLEGGVPLGSVCYVPTGGASLVFAGIAHPQPFFDHLRKVWGVTQMRAYPDHHHFTPKELAELDALAQQGVTLFTTEKDATRLSDALTSYSSLAEHLFYVPIRLVWRWGSELELERIWNEVSQSTRSGDGAARRGIPPTL